MLFIRKGPYLQNPTEHSMTIMWETSLPAASRVDVMYAERIHSGHQGNYKQPVDLFGSFSNESLTKAHKLTVDGLDPETPYYYRIYSWVGSSETESTWFMFKTAAGQGKPFSFTVTSETGGYSGFDSTDGEINRRIFQQMKHYRPDIALFIGDIVHDEKNEEDWNRYFFDPGREFIVDTPIYSCLGNHEDNASWYYDLFAFPEPKNFYAFHYGDAHFICLDSTDGIVYIVAGGAGAMPNWLLPKREWHTSQSLAVPHFLQVVVTEERLEIRAIDDEGRLFDQLRIRKNAEGERDFFRSDCFRQPKAGWKEGKNWRSSH